MDHLAEFYGAIRKEPTMTLATAADGRVTMRLVSPAYYEGAVLLFTAGDSQKYRQLRANPRCCLAVGPFFAEAEAAFFGSTMRAENKPLREAYSAKFPDAFAEGVAFNGRDEEFLLLRPLRLTGWAYEDDAPDPAGIPTAPFEIEL